MKGRRRLTFQLTPLLDLLLIVIFAQYMEVRQQADAVDLDVSRREQELTERLQAEHDRQMEHLQQQRQQLAAQRQQYGEQFDSIVNQHVQAGNALASALNLPTTVMKEILKLRAEGNMADARNLEAASMNLKQVLESRGDEMLRFLLKYDEMQKHVSVWELHLQDNGQAMFSDGTQQQVVVFGTMDEFVSRCFEASKGFTEPRPLVIILMTYGDAQAGLRRRATEGLPLLTEQLRRDAGNARWFDFSLMGFRPDGPLIGITNP